MAMICAVAAYVPMLVSLIHTGCTRPDKVTAVMHEDVWVRIFRRYSKMAPLFPVRPFSAGLLALGMMDQLQILREGGIAIINPEGDLSWDGQPLPIRPGAAWLALHTAVPLVPMACSAGAYDIWPLWQRRPSLRGHIVFRIGRPFQLCDRPMPRVTPQDLEHANARFRTVLDELCFGPGGVAEWATAPSQDGVPLEQNQPELASPEPLSMAPCEMSCPS